MSPSTLSGYVHGSTSPPLDALIRLADYFTISLDDLVLGQLAEPNNVAEEDTPHYGDNARLCYLDAQTGIPIPSRRLYIPGLPASTTPWLIMSNPLHGMEPAINVGDLITFRPVTSVVQFSVCLVSTSGHAYLGRVKQDVDDGVEYVRVVAENKSVPTVDIPRDQVTGFYKIHTAFRSEKF